MGPELPESEAEDGFLLSCPPGTHKKLLLQEEFQEPGSSMRRKQQNQNFPVFTQRAPEGPPQHTPCLLDHHRECAHLAIICAAFAASRAFPDYSVRDRQARNILISKFFVCLIVFLFIYFIYDTACSLLWAGGTVQ